MPKIAQFLDCRLPALAGIRIARPCQHQPAAGEFRLFFVDWREVPDPNRPQTTSRTRKGTSSYRSVQVFTGPGVVEGSVKVSFKVS